MTQTIWIARHGNRIDFVRPEWFNTAERPYDPHLSEDGEVQARELSARLKGEGITHIFASPFLRTVQTANYVAEAIDLPIKLEWGLCEWLNREWMTKMPETLPPEALKAQFPRIDLSYRSLVQPQYPETDRCCSQRTAKTAKLLVERYSTDLLWVGHGASVAGTAVGLLEEDRKINASLCCIVKLARRDTRWAIELDGDTSHLSQPQTKIRLN